MAWDTTIVNKLRYVIGDYDSTAYIYASADLEKFLLVAASQVLFDLESSDFVVNFDSETITPDPTSDSAYLWFENFMILKAACLIVKAQLRAASLKGGYKIVDDRSTIDTTGAVGSAKESVKSFCEDYEDALEKALQYGAGAAGVGIFGPYQEYLGE